MINISISQLNMDTILIISINGWRKVTHVQAQQIFWLKEITLKYIKLHTTFQKYFNI